MNAAYRYIITFANGKVIDEVLWARNFDEAIANAKGVTDGGTLVAVALCEALYGKALTEEERDEQDYARRWGVDI